MDTAPIWKRIIGAIVDWIALIIITFVYGYATGTASGASVNIQGWKAVGLFAIGFLYYVGLEATTGKTLGKLVLGMRVVTADGERIGWGRSFLRNLLRIVDWLPFLYLVGFITMIASKDRQRVGDHAAKTYVVNG